MRYINLFVLFCTALFCFHQPLCAEKTRVIVTTDIGGADPDDKQSLVHLLTLLDRVDLEAIVYQYAWVPFEKDNETKALNPVLDAYEEVYPNLKMHSDGFPDADHLRGIVRRGQIEAAMAGTGEGKDTPGSEMIISIVDKDDPRPVWITAWSGMNTLAQALWKVRQTRSEAEVKKFVSKIRVYDILGQDEAGAWMVTEFPELVYIRNKEVYGWPPSNEWFRENIQNKGVFGRQYPDTIWATEGDSPSFLYVIDNGLNFPEHPDWGGWGGRFDAERKEGIRSMDWVVRSNLDETKFDPYYMFGASAEGADAIIRWADDINNDFVARMEWTMTPDYSKVNHHPQAVIGKDRTTDAVHMKVKAGRTVRIDASRSTDPDGDVLNHDWIFYKEPGTYEGNLDYVNGRDVLEVDVPSDAVGTTLHIVLRVTDNGRPALTSYRRVILECR